ncbi:MAG: hypothetical protein ACODAG_09255, partial [Myxococcota bacterium]
MRSQRQRQPTVVHVTRTLLRRSETFIQQRLVGRRFAPTALAWKHVPDSLEIPCPHRILGQPPFTRLPPALEPLGRHAETLGMLARLHPTVVHAHFGLAGLRVDRACQVLGTPLIVSFYGFDASSRPN